MCMWFIGKLLTTSRITTKDLGVQCASCASHTHTPNTQQNMLSATWHGSITRLYYVVRLVSVSLFICSTLYHHFAFRRDFHFLDRRCRITTLSPPTTAIVVVVIIVFVTSNLLNIEAIEVHFNAKSWLIHPLQKRTSVYSPVLNTKHDDIGTKKIRFYTSQMLRKVNILFLYGEIYSMVAIADVEWKSYKLIEAFCTHRW